jgi:RHS repeat-associated protein
MAGSGDATAPSTSLTAALRAGDYQIGQNMPPPEGFPAYETLYRDATFQLGFSRWFDRSKRLLAKGDRTNRGISDTSVPTIGEVTDRPLWQMNPSYNGNTGLLVISSVFSRRTTPDGTANEFATFAQNQFYEETSNDGLINAQRADDIFTRDAAGRITQNQRFYGGGAGSVSTYTYSADGRRLAQLVNIDGTHDFTYNSRGLVETQTVGGEGTYTFGYDEMGRSSELEFPDGHLRHQRYDELGRLTSRCYEYSLGTMRCYTAQYDAVGDPVRMTDPDGVDVLEYDALDRLKKVARYLTDGVTQVGVEDYAFNALGALKVNAGVTLDDQRPKLAGGGTADAAVPNTIDGIPVALNAGGFVTSLRGTSFTYDSLGNATTAQDPIPAALETYWIDATGRRYRKDSTVTEFYVFEGLDRVAVTQADAVTPKETYLFDGIDHPLRIKIVASGTTAYYELDLAGNVRGLRASGGADLGGYRYTAFGQTVEDTTTITQPLRWKGRWFSPIAGGIYDVRARQWSPEMGAFLAVDEFWAHDSRATLWSWPQQNPPRFSDPKGRGPEEALPFIGLLAIFCLVTDADFCHPLENSCEAAARRKRKRSKKEWCLDATHQGSVGREAVCRALAETHPAKAAECWKVVEGSDLQWQVMCQGL